MAHIVMAYIVLAYIFMAYIVTAYIVMAYIVMAYIITASLIVPRCFEPCPCSFKYGVYSDVLCSYGPADRSAPPRSRPALFTLVLVLCLVC